MVREMDRDTELVTLARRGERPAFDELVRRHYAMVRRIAYRFAGIAEDADDLAQEAFVTACERLHQLEQPDRFAGWLAAIVRSEGLMWRRRRLTQPSFLELDADIVPTEPDWESVRRASIRDAVTDALSTLTDEQRQVVRLHYLIGCDYRETADLLDIPVDAVRGRLDRARRVLRKELQEMTSSTSGWELNARDLDALRGAGAMASTDPERKPVNAIHLTGKGRVVGTDGHRLFCYGSQSLNGTPSALIHADFGRMLRDQFPEVRHGRLTLTDSEAVMGIPGGDEIRSPLLTEEYVQWQKIIPAEEGTVITAKVGHWLHALEMLARQREAGPARPEEVAKRILMVFAPDEGRVTLREGEWPVPDDGIAWEVSVSFPAKFISGEAELIVAANAVYVEQAVRALGIEPEDEMEFSSAGELKAFVMQPVADESVFVVTMPMQRYWTPPAEKA